MRHDGPGVWQSGAVSDSARQAPGWPGLAPRWTSSAKCAVGTALQSHSRVWFTLSHGIVNEVYYPRLDQACLRDLGLIVTDGREFFSEEKRSTHSVLSWMAPGAPAFELVNTCEQGRYRIHKQVLTDPDRDVLLQHIRFQPLLGVHEDYRLHVLLAPHLANAGAGNTAWVGDYKGVAMLFAERHGSALALACSSGLSRGSAGFVGASDGWQDLVAHKALTMCYPRAADGNVALVAQLQPDPGDGSLVLALAFGGTADEAGLRARASLADGFEHARSRYVGAWEKWQARLISLPVKEPATATAVKRSAAVLRSHESKRLPGAMIASLSIPWGNTKGDNDLGGYHLVWPRDLVESAGALVAMGAHDDALRVLRYLQATQNADGSWPQNMWVDGTPYWHGIQLDETAFPILLVDLLRRDACSHRDLSRDFWPMVRAAAAFIVCNGPVTQQDRWEEDGGLSPFTVAVEIAGLLVAADLAGQAGEPSLASYLRETADAWNDGLDECIYARDTALARRVGVEGYYVRIAPQESADAASPLAGFVPIKNRPWSQSRMPASEIVSPDALALVRFGLRAADDPRILGTLRVIDALLKVEMPFGPVWRRYNGDGYGEHADGSAFDGTGIGRPWPLLTGERAHYEIAAGNMDEARRLLRTFEACANEGGLLSEQVWDGLDVPQHARVFGRPSGSAMPLVWAHAEYLKLVRSLCEGRVFDLPPQTWQRYVVQRRRSSHACWRFNHRLRSMASGRTLRIETLAACRVHWSADGWLAVHDASSRDSGLGTHLVDLPTADLPVGAAVLFTFYWPQVQRWEQVDYRVEVSG